MPNDKRLKRLHAFWNVLRSLEDREVITFKELKKEMNSYLKGYDKLTVGELSRFMSQQGVVKVFSRRADTGRELIFLHSHKNHGKI